MKAKLKVTTEQETAAERADDMAQGIAALIAEEEKHDAPLPGDWSTYFVRRLAWLSARQSEGEREFPEGMSDPYPAYGNKRAA